jgi:hypothetical protein
VGEDFVFHVEGRKRTGNIVYNTDRDIWVLLDQDKVEVDSIDANQFRTIREVKEGARKRLDEKGE